MRRPVLSKAALIISILFVLVAVLAPGQVDVMFYEDFENLNAGDTPDMFLPSGSANPDWDNQ